MSNISKEVLKKEIIDKCWQLSKESWKDENALSELKELNKMLVKKLKHFIILYTDSYNQSNDLRDYYSFYRLYNLKGAYLFALPSHGLELPISEWEKIMEIITRYPNDVYKSNSGGDYYSGYRVWRLSWPKSSIPLFKIAFNRMLDSDFEEQGWEEARLYYNIREIAEITGEDIDITQLV